MAAPIISPWTDPTAGGQVQAWQGRQEWVCRFCFPGRFVWSKTVYRQRLAIARGCGLRAAGTPSLPHKLRVEFLRCALGLSGQISTCIGEGALDQRLISSGKEKKKTPNNNKKKPSDPLQEAYSCTLGCVLCLRQRPGWCKSSDFNLIWWSRNHGMRASQSWKGLWALSG